MLAPKNGESSPLNPIRIETAFSRYPIHQLAKQKDIPIEIQERDKNGEVSARWEISHNSKHGQPGQLAYRIDSLIINRRIDESGKAIPKVLRLGSLRDIANETGTNVSNTNAIKKALFQNAAAFINASISYTGSDKEEYSIEFAAARYDVILTGKKLPDGTKADAVYILLHDLYHELLKRAQRRPLDYDYLKELAPAPQRFYELLSFQMFAALKNARPRARLLYSEYCTYAPQTRYFDYDHVKKQMFKVHAPHRKSEYLASVELRETIDAEGRTDWEMLYAPGRKAKAEFRHFTQPKKLAAAVKPKKQLTTSASPRAVVVASPPPPLTPPPQPEADPLISQLCSFGITESKAKHLVVSHRIAVEQQLAAYPYRNLPPAQTNAAGWLISAIEQGYELPPAFLETVRQSNKTHHAQGKRAVIDNCRLCNDSGFRVIKRPDGTGAAAKKCTHDTQTESQYENA